MANLLIDIGNSSIKLGLSERQTLEKTERTDRENIITAIDSFIAERNIDVAVISSVADGCEYIYDYVKSVSKKTILLDSKTELPVKIGYNTPSTLGADRIAAAVGANFLLPKEKTIIFDFGTAITIDFLSDEGVLWGGNISLGMNTRFKALNRFTGKLPLCERPMDINDIGVSTKTAIESGVVLGIMFEVEGYLQKYKDHRVVFTGGDSLYFAEKLKNPIFVIFNLNLIGLSYIADYHANN